MTETPILHTNINRDFSTKVLPLTYNEVNDMVIALLALLDSLEDKQD